jgi:dihydrofolate reductase
VIVSLIVAMDEAGGIGKTAELPGQTYGELQQRLPIGLPWHLGADLKNFKNITMGHHLIEGRKTYESIGKALPGRTNIIVTHNRDFMAPGCLVVHTLKEALALAEKNGETEAFIGGGGEIFAQALPLAQRIYLTRVHTRADCNVFFPQVDWREWQEGERVEQPADEKNDYAFTYSVFSK